MSVNKQTIEHFSINASFNKSSLKQEIKRFLGKKGREGSNIYYVYFPQK